VVNKQATIIALAALIFLPIANGKAQDVTNLLFIHHSCGGQLLAEPGPEAGGTRESGDPCIYVTHPNGGGMRTELERAGFKVNEASYMSTVGEATDICHWNRKFRDQMSVVLRTERQNQLLPEGQANAIVVFKSCYPNNAFISTGKDPGDPDSCERTIANAKAAYRALLPYFAQHPDVLFVAFTAPPLAEPKPVGVMGKIRSIFKEKPRADLAREFSAWMANGWLEDKGPRNVVVFDYYDVLTDHGTTNWSAYPTQAGRDSHPSTDGNRRAAEAFVPFLCETWRVFQAGVDSDCH
jgi:hypothetical protein